MTAPTSTAPAKRLRLRYSLRTLLLLVLLCGGGMALWRAREPWQVLRTITEPAPIRGFTLSPKGTYFATAFILKKEEGAQLAVRIYGSDSGKLVRESLQPLQPAMPNGRVGVEFSPGETYVTTVRLNPGSPYLHNFFSVKSGEFLPLAPNSFGFFTFSPNDGFLRDGNVLYRLPGMESVAVLGSAAPNSSCEFSQDESFVALGGSSAGSIWLFSTATGKVLKHFPLSGGSARMRLSPDGKTLAISQNTTKLYDISSEACVAEFEGKFPIFSTDGHYLATSLEAMGQYVVWERATKREVLRFPSQGAIEFRSGYVCNYWPKEIYDLQTGKRLWSSTSEFVQFDLVGKYALLQSKERMTLVDLATGEALQEFQFTSAPHGRMDGRSRRICVAFWTDTLTLSPHLHIYHRVRPERWWGYAWLPEFWLTLVLAAALAWSIYKDRSQISGKPLA